MEDGGMEEWKREERKNGSGVVHGRFMSGS
jgi:hypothetical protein